MEQIKQVGAINALECAPLLIQYYAIFDPTTMAVIGVYPEQASIDINSKLPIDNEVAERILNGTDGLMLYHVTEVDNQLVVGRHTATYVTDDILLHRIADKKYSNISDPDVLIKYHSDTKLLTVALVKQLPINSIKWHGITTLTFIVSAYNDPHIVYQSITCTIDKLINTPTVVPYIGPTDTFSIFSIRVFKKYMFEKVTSETH